jgi:hypothetical protein
MVKGSARPGVERDATAQEVSAAASSILEFMSIYDMLCLQRKEATAMGN